MTPRFLMPPTRATDYPAMRRLLMGEGAVGIDYIEVFDIPDLDSFIAGIWAVQRCSR